MIKLALMALLCFTATVQAAVSIAAWDSLAFDENGTYYEVQDYGRAGGDVDMEDADAVRPSICTDATEQRCGATTNNSNSSWHSWVQLDGFMSQGPARGNSCQAHLAHFCPAAETGTCAGTACTGWSCCP